MSEPLDFLEVLKAELRTILGLELPERQPPKTDEATADDSREREYEKLVLNRVDECGTDLSALCLSGGGIRSATFALGIIQGLARFGLLPQFHYLSSVSGGGYISGWLSLWRRNASEAEVVGGLNASIHTGYEAPQVTGLRRDSNYLTPRLGLLSADTWTVISLYVRNLALNWMLFVPFFMGCLVFPRLCSAVLAGAHDFVFPDLDNDSAADLFQVVRALAAILITLGLSFAIYGRFRRQKGWLTDSNFRLRVLVPLVASGALFTLAAVIVGYFTEMDFAREFVAGHLPYGAAWGAGVYFVAWLIGRLSSRPYVEADEKQIEWIDVVYWTLSGALVGVLAAVGMNTIAESLWSAPTGSSSQLVARHEAIDLAVVFGLSGFVLAYLVGEVFYVGIASLSRKGDMDREWLARSSGWLSAAAIAWALISGIALYAPGLLRHEWSRLIVPFAGGVSGLITLVLGSSSATAATRAVQALKRMPLMRIAGIAAVIFAVLLAALMSLFDAQLEGLLHGLLTRAPLWAIDAMLMIGLIGIAFVLSRIVNVNRFSMHALYRNRLVRAFLGSARAGARNADPFTGFDPQDNPPLHEVLPHNRDNRLFHVINAALNVVSAKNPAWQERKAESFTMSRLFCGNPYVGYRLTKEYGGPNGITLGTAMAISGAAVSPNQGYNSSPLIGFLMMLFNVRLGWWLGNPAHERTSRRDGPVYSLSPALRELAGDTSDDSRYIYLSDGGHFENLGLYEMVRRRCRLIVVSDAGCDPDCSFEDLGNAVRKIFIDFGVSIDFAKLELKARQNPAVPGVRFAVGSIHYPGSDRPGWLLYLKPTYQGTERADVRSYASDNPRFPHESTTDQWFSESQLESYRALGANVAEYVCSGGAGIAAGVRPNPMTLEDLKKVATALIESDTVKQERLSRVTTARLEHTAQPYSA